MLVRRIAATLVAAAAVFAARMPVVEAQSPADFFNPNVLHEIRLFMNSREAPMLRQHYLDNAYFPGDFQWGTTRVRNVAIRSRGAGSRSPTKLGLRIDFNKYTSGQQFAGVKAIDLDNLTQDVSMMREVLAMAFFARLGQPAPREVFCKLYINNEYQGVYVAIEEVDQDFLTRTIGENTGYLYEYKWQPNLLWYGDYLGDDLAPYKTLLEIKKPHDTETDNVVYSPVRDMVKEVNQPIDGVWRERVESRLDLGQFVTHVAIETFLAENDGILGFAGINNLYLYRFANSNRHRLLVWDKDNAFTFLDSRIMREIDHNAFTRQAMQFPDLKTLFLDVLTQCAQSATDGDWLINEINRYASLINDAVVADTKRPYSYTDFLGGVDFLRTFAGFRPGYVLLDVSINR